MDKAQPSNPPPPTPTATPIGSQPTKERHLPHPLPTAGLELEGIERATIEIGHHSHNTDTGSSGMRLEPAPEAPNRTATIAITVRDHPKSTYVEWAPIR